MTARSFPKSARFSRPQPLRYGPAPRRISVQNRRALRLPARLISQLSKTRTISSPLLKSPAPSDGWPEGDLPGQRPYPSPQTEAAARLPARRVLTGEDRQEARSPVSARESAGCSGRFPAGARGFSSSADLMQRWFTGFHQRNFRPHLGSTNSSAGAADTRPEARGHGFSEAKLNEFEISFIGLELFFQKDFFCILREMIFAHGLHLGSQGYGSRVEIFANGARFRLPPPVANGSPHRSSS